jgi:hypothetical protein
MATYSQHSAMATVVTYPTLANEHWSDPTADTDLYLMVFRRYGRLYDTTTVGCHNNGNAVLPRHSRLLETLFTRPTLAFEVVKRALP